MNWKKLPKSKSRTLTSFLEKKVKETEDRGKEKKESESQRLQKLRKRLEDKLRRQIRRDIRENPNPTFWQIMQSFVLDEQDAFYDLPSVARDLLKPDAFFEDVYDVTYNPEIHGKAGVKLMEVLVEYLETMSSLNDLTSD